MPFRDFADGALERWSVERAADWQSLGSGSAVVGKRIGHRSRLSGRAAEGDWGGGGSKF